MSPRTYRLGQRAVAVEATRANMLAAARDLLLEGGHPRLSLDSVASRADVARATVYHHFGSKLGLLEALATDAERRAGKEGLNQVQDASAGEPALRLLCSEIARFWAAEHVVFRVFGGLRGADPAVAAVAGRHDAGRKEALAQLVLRLDREEVLGPGWTLDEGTDVLWLLTSFEVFDHLYSRSRMPVTKIGSILFGLARNLLEPRSS